MQDSKTDGASSKQIKKCKELLEALETRINEFFEQHMLWQHVPVTEADWSGVNQDLTDKEAQAGYLTLALAAIDSARFALKDDNIGQAVEQSLRAGVFAAGVLDTASRQRLYAQYGGRQTKHWEFWEEIEDKARLQTHGNRTDSEIAGQLLSWYLDNHSVDKDDLPAPATLRKRIGKWRAEEKSRIDKNN